MLEALQNPRLAEQVRCDLSIVHTAHCALEEFLAGLVACHVVQAAFDHAHGMSCIRGGRLGFGRFRNKFVLYRVVFLVFLSLGMFF